MWVLVIKVVVNRGRRGRTYVLSGIELIRIFWSLIIFEIGVQDKSTTSLFRSAAGRDQRRVAATTSGWWRQSVTATSWRVVVGRPAVSVVAAATLKSTACTELVHDSELRARKPNVTAQDDACHVICRSMKPLLWGGQ